MAVSDMASLPADSTLAVLRTRERKTLKSRVASSAKTLDYNHFSL